MYAEALQLVKAAFPDQAGGSAARAASSSMTAAEQITPVVTEHGEGPVWWPDRTGLRWVDMLAGDVLILSDSGEVRRQYVGKVAAALRPRRTGSPGPLMAARPITSTRQQIGSTCSTTI
ncbi:hypothetical protein ACFV9C_05800 [Kribbella sp. NPDC059898]|uniref:hypothetical protein n=1 Tax=Kribbella sp. NPDC059898 TaxID=3346995 RepID=UPI00365CC5E3